MTDDFMAYRSVGERPKWHGVVKHSNKEYVRGTDHTNAVEGFFSVLKRGINGVYQHVGRGHLARYCDELAFRYENRSAVGVNDAQRAALIMKGANSKRLTYEQPESTS